MPKNIGKSFENEIKDSIKSDIFYYRFRDTPASYAKDKQTIRYIVPNPCDIFLFKSPYLYFLELKNVTSKKYFSFDTTALKQIERMNKLGEYEKFIKGFIITFRDFEETYFLELKDVNMFLKESGKKSINKKECDALGTHLPQQKKVKYYLYDLSPIIK